MRLPPAKRTDDTNAQSTPQTEQNMKRENYMMLDLPSTFPNRQKASDTSKTPRTRRPSLPTFPSQLLPGDPNFYLAPSITQAMQNMPPTVVGSLLTFCSLSYWPNHQHTLETEYNTAESSKTNQSVKVPSDNIVTSVFAHQDPPRNVKSVVRSFLKAQNQSRDSKEQATLRQQDEKKAGAGAIHTSMSQACSPVSDPMILGKMLELRQAQLEQKDRELTAAQKSIAQLHANLSDMEDEFAGAQAKLEQKNIYIFACDKKIDALQKRIALLTRPFKGPTDWQLRTDTKMDVNAEPHLNKPASKLKKYPVPPAQSSVEIESQSELEDRYLLSAKSKGRRRVAKECSWTNQDPSKKNEEPIKENQELKEEVDQAHAVDTSKSTSVSVRPKMHGKILDGPLRQEISDAATSDTEADQVKGAEGEGNGDAGQRANISVSQSSQCGSDWADVERSDLEKECVYARW